MRNLRGICRSGIEKCLLFRVEWCWGVSAEAAADFLMISASFLVNPIIFAMILNPTLIQTASELMMLMFGFMCTLRRYLSRMFRRRRTFTGLEDCECRVECIPSFASFSRELWTIRVDLHQPKNLISCPRFRTARRRHSIS